MAAAQCVGRPRPAAGEVRGARLEVSREATCAPRPLTDAATLALCEQEFRCRCVCVCAAVLFLIAPSLAICLRVTR